MNLTKTQLSKKIAKDIGCKHKKASEILTVIEEEDEDEQMYYPGKQWKNSIA